MAWRIFSAGSRYLGSVTGAVVLALILIWVVKIRDIQRLRVEISQLESKIGQGQELWRSYPPLGLEQTKRFQQTQERLFHALPKDRDIPSLLQEVSRLAQEYNVTDVTFSLGDGASPGAGPSVPLGAPSSQGVAPAPSPSGSPGVSEASGPVASFPIKMGFAGDYREIAYFLEALQKLPRLVTVQSLQLQRSAPLVAGELVVHAYYQKGNLSEAGK